MLPSLACLSLSVGGMPLTETGVKRERYPSQEKEGDNEPDEAGPSERSAPESWVPTMRYPEKPRR